MSYTLPTFAQLVTEIGAKIRGYRTDASMGPGSDGAILRDTLAHVVGGLHLHLLYGVLHNLIPTKASYPIIDAWAFLFGLSDGSGGYGRIKVRGSSATDGFTFTATAATADLQDEQFTDSAGLIYKINQSYSFAGAGSATLDVAAVSTGDATNVKVSDGESFAWVSAPANMSDTITQAADLSGGADREEDAALRARLQEKLQTPPQGGNWADWKRWIEDVSPGELTGYVLPKRQYDGVGYGTVDVIAFRTRESGAERFIASTDPEYDLIETALEDHGPVLMIRNHRQLTVSPSSQDLTVALEMASNATAAQLCDWDAFAVIAAQVTSTTVLTREVTVSVNVCSPTLTNGIEAGHRVVINEAEATVLAVNVGGNAAVFTVESWPTAWGAADDAINGLTPYSGGGVIMQVVEALRALGDSLGPAKGTTAAPIPGWEDSLRLAAIKSAVIQACGGAVVDMAIGLPAADVVPATDYGATIPAIAVDQIVAWEPK